MDALTRLLELARVRGALDVRCQLAGAFDLGHDESAPGESPFHLVLAGQGVLEWSGGTVALAAGDLVVLPGGRSHRVRDTAGARPAVPPSLDESGPFAVKRNSASPPDLDLLCGRFIHAPDATPLLFAGLPEALHVRLAEPGEGMHVLHALVALFRDEVAALAPGALAVVTALSHALLVLALRRHLGTGTVAPSLLSLLAEPRLARSLHAMLADPAHEWTVATLAEQAAMSRATFARHFEQRTHGTPLDVLTLLRMHLAAEALRRGHASTAAVGESVGYRSESAFNKAFGRVMGTTPARYRRDALFEQHDAAA